MLCLIVAEVVPPQKINNIELEVVKFWLDITLTSVEKCENIKTILLIQQ